MAAFNGHDLRLQPLVKCQVCLQAYRSVSAARPSLPEPFEDDVALLHVAEQRGLEGVVSKRRDATL
jgi:ATP-dependent DNA ligase